MAHSLFAPWIDAQAASPQAGAMILEKVEAFF
jgi:hypothetical protein